MNFGSYQRRDKRLEELEAECEDTLHESVQIAAQTNITSQATAEQLYMQTEQIRQIHHETDRVGENLETSEYLLRGLKSWWGAVSQIFVSPPKRNPSDTSDLPPEPAVLKSRSPTIAKTEKRNQHQKNEFNTKIDDNLDELSDMLGELHQRAIMMNHEISKQNIMLDSVDHNVNKNNSMLQKQKKDLEQIAGKR